MFFKLLAILTLCTLMSLIGYVSCAGGFQTGFPYCYIQGEVVHFNKLLRDKESCTIFKCKKGKKPTVETFKCQGLDQTVHVDFFTWCTENQCATT